jgi:hypothetical protein
MNLLLSLEKKIQIIYNYENQFSITMSILSSFKGFNLKKSDLIVLLIFSLTIILSRIPFKSKFLYESDSVGFAFAFQHFNILINQPQAPGYIFFVALGNLVNFILHDPNISMIFINIVFSILTVLFVYFLVKQLFSKGIAVVTSIILIFNPIFWFYGETATIYMSEALFASLIAYTSYQFLKGDSRFLYISAVVLGVAGGFRPDLIVFMFPLWIFCLSYNNFEYMRIIKAFLVLIASTMLWFIPTLIFSGGSALLTINLWTGFFKSTSVVYGANLTSQLIMDNMLLSWTILGIGILSIFILYIFIFFNLKKVFSVSNLKNCKVIFLLLWIIPAFLFYLLIYIAKPGYTLVYLPVFAIVIGYVIFNLSYDLNMKIKRIPKNYLIIILIIVFSLFSISQFFSPVVSGVDYGSIQSQDVNTQHVIQSIQEFNPSNTIIFFQGENDSVNSVYYCPDYDIYSSSDIHPSSGTSYLSVDYYIDHKFYGFDGQTFEIHLNSSTNNIVWLIDSNSEFFKQLQSKIEIKTIILADGNVIYYSEVDNNTNFTIDNLTFIKD